MKTLNYNEIKVMSETLNFTIEETREIADIFYREKHKDNYRLNSTSLDSVEDYIREYDNNWFRYSNWQQLIESEIEQGSDGLDEDECRKLIGEAIFQLSSGMYIQTVY